MNVRKSLAHSLNQYLRRIVLRVKHDIVSCRLIHPTGQGIEQAITLKRFMNVISLSIDFTITKFLFILAEIRQKKSFKFLKSKLNPNISNKFKTSLFDTDFSHF